MVREKHGFLYGILFLNYGNSNAKKSILLPDNRVIFALQFQKMTVEEITQIENEIFTKLVIDLLKQQRAEGKKEFLLDKFEVDQLIKERLKIFLNKG